MAFWSVPRTPGTAAARVARPTWWVAALAGMMCSVAVVISPVVAVAPAGTMPAVQRNRFAAALPSALGAGEGVGQAPAPVGSDPAAQDQAVRQAEQSGTPVTVPGSTTETATLQANPDGTLTSQLSPGPVRYQDAAGNWPNIDLSLVQRQDGSLVATGAKASARFAPAAGPAGTATLPTSAGDVVLSHTDAVAGGSLKVVGGTATYPGALPGGRDLVEKLLVSGFEESVVLHSAVDPGFYTAVLSLPVGVTAKSGGSGVLLVDGSGLTVGSVGGGYAHDSIVNGSGEGVSAPVTTQLVKQIGPSLTVQIGVDPQWLTDPARVFPVTIDPVFTANTYQTPGSYDAYVDSVYNTTAEGAFDPTTLKVGTFNGGGEVDRSYLYFNGVPQNVQVTEAHMTLYNSYSYSCGGNIPAVSAYGAYSP